MEKTIFLNYLWRECSYYYNSHKVIELIHKNTRVCLFNFSDTPKNRLFAAALLACVYGRLYQLVGWVKNGIPYDNGTKVFVITPYDCPEHMDIPDEVYDIVFEAGFSYLSL